MRERPAFVPATGGYRVPMRARTGLLFLLLALVWGSAFMWIAVAVDAGASPWVVACGRLGLGAATVGACLWLASPELRAGHAPARLRAWIGPMAVMGLLLGAIPFTLLAYGERTVSSGIAAMLMATVPLWVVAIAFAGVPGTAEERVGPAGLAGLLVGFAGVALLVAGDTGASGLAGVALILVTTVSYAAGGLYARRLAARGIPPLAGPLGVGVFGALACLPGAAVAVAGGEGPDLPAAGAIVALGVGCTGIAYLLYFELNRQWGAARAATVTYVIPVVGIALGVLFLGEAVGLAQIGGLGLILAGVLVANGRVLRLRGRPEQA